MNNRNLKTIIFAVFMMIFSFSIMGYGFFTFLIKPIVFTNQTTYPEALISENMINNTSNVPFDLEQFENSINSIVDETKPSVVGVLTQTSDGMSSGSGVIYKKTDDKYYAITNQHVIDDNVKVDVVLYNKEIVLSTVIFYDALADVAVLEFTPNSTPNVASIGKSSEVVAGDFAIAVGSPLGFDNFNASTFGIIANTSAYVDYNDYSVFIHHDAAINPGNSGGPLFNSKGQVIGINTLKLFESSDGRQTDSMGYAIPIDKVVKIINEYSTHGSFRTPKMGVMTLNVFDANYSGEYTVPDGVYEGAYITEVVANSAAANAGLKVDDIVVSLNGEKVATRQDLKHHLLYGDHTIGKTVELIVNRNGSEIKLNLEIQDS